jgi:hypothetical protein
MTFCECSALGIYTWQTKISQAIKIVLVLDVKIQNTVLVFDLGTLDAQ